MFIYFDAFVLFCKYFSQITRNEIFQLLNCVLCLSTSAWRTIASYITQSMVVDSNEAFDIVLSLVDMNTTFNQVPYFTNGRQESRTVKHCKFMM